MRNIILASSSPRRKQLFEMIRIPFKVHKSSFIEKMDNKIEPNKLCEKLSKGKALDVAKHYHDAIVIGADTFVVLDGEYLGKAVDNSQAREMLLKLSGKRHTVITAFTIIDTKTKKSVTESIKSSVYFKKLSFEEIDFYVKSGEPLGKAGAYAIQGLGGLFVKKIEGDFFTIVGLPIGRIIQLLPSFDFNFFSQ